MLSFCCGIFPFFATTDFSQPENGQKSCGRPYKPVTGRPPTILTLGTLFFTEFMYYHSKTIPGKNFDQAIALVTEALKQEGFGVLTEIDVQATLKKKLDVDFKKYRILGACNPQFAYQSLQAEDKIGVFLPCNVVVEENETGEVEVSAVDPVASMMAVQNPSLAATAGEVREKLLRVINNLG